ncbi:MAG: type I-C CRISPR-associated protein Cas7/Csd2 [Alphaproteobacteria bacterium]|nr:type I-C CRISPR-associated protein Cas7/Csd2 [Alphaproteobacteria bacterium]QQS58518.1 MAG: type I-C CRISPR-associated protein Cas7/Csd2 [Alphaproteobacteria bacterium]
MSNTNPVNRAEFVLIFDVKDGNPNGDPDAGNLPRMDAETGKGLITDVCLKRKIRNYVGIVKGEQPPFEIYVKERAVLNKTHERAYKAIGVDISEGKEGKRKGGGDDVAKARDWMCQNFYDVRTFGAVMSTGVNCGQVRGPVQITFARSVDPIVALEHSITRMAVATEKEAEKQDGDNRTMGRKHTVSYGLYVAHGFISGHLAQQTGFSQGDMDLLLEALANMFDHDRSAARGEMTTRGLYVFQHNNLLGNAPAHSLLDRIQVSRRSGVDVPRSFADYDVSIDDNNLPQGVTLKRVVELPALKKAA